MVPFPVVRALVPLILSCAIGAIVVETAQQPQPRPRPSAARPAPAPAKPALAGALIIEVDSPAAVVVDDQAIGVVYPESLRRIPVSLGEHVVLATSTDSSTVRVRQLANVEQPGQVVVRLELGPQLWMPRPCVRTTPAAGTSSPVTAAGRSNAAIPQARAILRVGNEISSPQKLKDAAPVYPKIAVAARVSGIVIVEAVINRSGRVQSGCILRSIPMLDQAALDAIRQWEYSPALLNGQPVDVVMTVTVNFALE